MPVTGGVCHGGQAGGLHPLLLHTDWRIELPVTDPRAAIGQESRQSGRKAGPGASAAGSSRGAADGPGRRWRPPAGPGPEQRRARSARGAEAAGGQRPAPAAR